MGSGQPPIGPGGGSAELEWPGAGAKERFVRRTNDGAPSFP
jgi:hypothetical protein